MRKYIALPAALALGVGLVGPVAAVEEGPRGESRAVAATDSPTETVARVRVPSTDTLRQLAADGVDVTYEVAQGPNGTFDATVIVRGGDLGKLRRHGAVVLDSFAGPTQAELARELKGNAAKLTAAQKRQAKPPATGADEAVLAQDRPGDASSGARTAGRRPTGASCRWRCDPRTAPRTRSRSPPTVARRTRSAPSPTWASTSTTG